MQVYINGKEYIFNDKDLKDITLSTILNNLNIPQNNIVAEVNGTIVTKDKFVATVIEENAVIELVQFVGGG